MSSRHDDPQFKIRIPAHLKAKLEEEARANGRTISGEILQRIEAGASNDARLADFLREEAAELEILLAGAKIEYEDIRGKLDKLIDKMIARGPDNKDQYEVEGYLTLGIEHRWAADKVNEYESRLRRIKRALGE